MTRLPAKHCRFLAAAIVGASLLVSATAWAKSSDRNQEMSIDAGQSSGTLDDRQPTILSGGVTISQGSLLINAGTATVSSRDGDPVRAVLSGSPVRMKQQLDDGTPMSATASQVDYDLKADIVVMTGNVNIQQPRGSVQSQRVVYNMKTGQVNSGGEGGGRVKMLIKPRNQQTATPPAAAPDKKPGTN